MRILLVLYVTMILFVGCGKTRKQSISCEKTRKQSMLFQLTSNSVKYWEDSCSGDGFALFIKDNLYIEYEKGRYAMPEIHRVNHFYIVRNGYLELYRNETLQEKFRIILEKDSIIGLYSEISHINLTASKDQKKGLSQAPMMRMGYVHAFFDERSYQLFFQNVDSLMKAFAIDEEQALGLLTSNRVVLKIDSDGNVISCGFLKDGFVQNKENYNLFEKEIMKLCYQIKCKPAKDKDTNETFESYLSTIIINNEPTPNP